MDLSLSFLLIIITVLALSVYILKYIERKLFVPEFDCKRHKEKPDLPCMYKTKGQCQFPSCPLLDEYLKQH